MSQKSKFLQWIDYRVRVTILDNRMFLGTFLAYDKHLNVVLSECEEFRRIKPKKQGDPEKEIKRALGMVIIRGENIVSITAEAPPNVNKKLEQAQGQGKSQPIDRKGVQPTSTQQNVGLGGMPIGIGQIPTQNMAPNLGQIPTNLAGGNVRPPTSLPPMMNNIPGMINLQGNQKQ